PDVETVLYSTILEFEQLRAKKNFDLFMINNDFSSADILENIKVTLNPARPLVFPANADRLQKLVRHAENIDSQEEKATSLKEIEKDLLLNGDIVPIAFMNIIYFVRNGLD